MAVLIEAISVIIKRSAIEDKFPGGWDGFLSDVPNQTLCADDELVRVGFMTPADVESYVKHLEEFGLRYLVNGLATDIVVADQQRGLAAPGNWAEFGHVSLDEESATRVAACRAKNSTLNTLASPPGWQYEGSFSQTFGFVPSEHVDRSLKFLRHEDGVDVYLNKLTGKEVYVGRTGRS